MKLDKLLVWVLLAALVVITLLHFFLHIAFYGSGISGLLRDGVSGFSTGNAAVDRFIENSRVNHPYAPAISLIIIAVELIAIAFVSAFISVKKKRGEEVEMHAHERHFNYAPLGSGVRIALHADEPHKIRKETSAESVEEMKDLSSELPKEDKWAEPEQQEKPEEKPEKEPEKEPKEPASEKKRTQTDIDLLYHALLERKYLRLSEAAKLFKVEEDTIMEWCKILEGAGLVTINYPRMKEAEISAVEQKRENEKK